MIRSLRLKNLALVDDLLWEPGPGSNTLSGETGAGKSMLVGGLNLLLGERADKTMIRTGEASCAIEAEIELGSKPLLRLVNAVLEEIGAETCDGAMLLLKRSFTSAGANKQFANGSPVTLAALKRLGDLLVDVHGPHDHQSLLSPERQMAILDSYGKLDPLRQACADAFHLAKSIAEKREALVMNERERSQKMEMLSFQVNEIETSALRPGEDETVENEYRLARHAHQLQELAGTINGLLRDTDGAALTQLAQVERALIAWQKLDPSFAETAALNRNAIVQLEELASSIDDSVSKMEGGATRLPQLEERINLIQKLKRKYGATIPEIIAFGENAKMELEAVENSAAALEKLEKEEKTALAALEKAAVALGEARRQVARPLGQKIETELRALGFQKALFRIECSPAASTGPAGADHIEFIFAPNVGEEPRRLRAIASSGEMARVMLAIKTTLAAVDEIPILIFDEVDANVGGETSIQVGRKLRQLGESHQVICITHLPQVAALGRHHFAVSKKVKQGRSCTEINTLEGADRIAEIARMLGGQSEASLALAKSLLAEK